MANRFLSNININDEYTLPSADGDADQIIQTDGAGNLSFVDLSSIEGASSNFVYFEVKNETGSPINKGKGVMAVGTDGNSGHILIDEMVADGSVEPKYFLGVLETTVANGGFARVISFGQLDQFNTNGQNGETWNDGNILWCDPDSAGDFTITEPDGPNVKIAAAIVLNASTNGKIQIRVQANEGIHDLHDTKIASQVDGDVLVWDDTTGVWFNDSTLNVDYTNSKVGIGTTSPSHPLSVFANPSDGQIAKYKRTSNSGAWLELENNVGGFGLGTNGTEFYVYDRNNLSYSLVINSSGNVGMGTTSPGAKLEVNSGATNVTSHFVSSDNQAWISIQDSGSGTYGALIGTDSDAGNDFAIANASAVKTFVINNGNVGIGTTSPNHKLDVDGGAQFNTNTGTTPFYITRLGGTSQALAIAVLDDNVRFESIQDESADNYGGFDFRMDGGTTEPNFTIRKNSADPILHVDGSGKVGINSTNPSSTLQVGDGTVDSSFRTYYNDNTYAELRGYGINFNRQYSYLRPTNDNTNFLYIGSQPNTWSELHLHSNKITFSDNTSEVMRINPGGNVGIGTTSPASALHINQTYPQVRLQSTGDNTYTNIGSGSNYMVWDIINPSTNTYQWRSGGSAQMTIDTSGNVGIGTTTPGGKLHVVGNVKITETAATSDTDKFVVLDSGVLKYRTGSQIISDLPTDSRYVAVAGDTMNGSLDVNADVQANTFSQAATGIPRSNLGSPTVTEMALFDSQFTPKTTLANNYNDLTDLTFWVQTTSSSAWTEVTTYSDDQKRRFLRTNNSSVIIPNAAYKFRVEFNAKSYTYANALYMYWASQSHNTTVHIWKQRSDNDTWYQHTSSTQTVSSWPGHLWLPFSTIPWHETASTATHYHKIRVEFEPTWSTGTYADRDIILYGGQIWGGYPSGRRTPHYYDQNGKLSTWGDFDVNGTAIIDGNVGIGMTSPSYKLDVNGDVKVGTNLAVGNVFGNKGTNQGINFEGPSTALQTARVDSDAFRFYFGGTGGEGEVFRILEGGNVGIGTASPISIGGHSGILTLYGSNATALALKDAVSEGHLRFNDFNFKFTNSGGDVRMQIEADTGNVGIGTSSPNEILHIESSSPKIQLTDTSTNASSYIDADSGFGSISIMADHGNTSASSQINLMVDGSSKMVVKDTGNVGIGTTSPGATLEVAKGSEGDYLIVGGDNASNARALVFSSSTAVSNGALHTITAQSGNGQIAFSTGGTEALRIDSSQNVGIGTTSPGEKLDVVGRVRGERFRTTTGGDASFAAYYFLGDSDTGTFQPANNIFGITTAGTERMRITDAGNVGIGITSPTYKLSVSGGVKAGGKITYTKSAGSLDTTGYAVAGLTTSSNGNSAGFTFTCFGSTGDYQKVVYSCYNGAGTWYTKKVIDEGTNAFDIEASANAATITFTFKSTSGTKSYSPRVTVEATGSAINSTYA